MAVEFALADRHHPLTTNPPETDTMATATASIPLDEQIVASLTGIATSEQVAAVLADAKVQLADLTRQADAADVASLSPLATADEARRTRARGSDLRFEADRLDASVSALEARLADLVDAERAAARDARLREVRAERDALAADIARDYPTAVVLLAGLAKRIVANDALLKTVSLNPDTESAEAMGRGLSSVVWIGDAMRGAPVLRIHNVKIPMPASTAMAWKLEGADPVWPGLDCAPHA